MNEVIVLVGLPGSGKTTWATNYVKENQSTLIVNLDCIREMLFGKYDYRDFHEPLVYKIAINAIDGILKSGCNVIIDDSMLTLTRKSRAIIVNYIRSRDYANKYSKHTITAIEFIYSTFCEESRLRNHRGLGPLRWANTIDTMRQRFESVYPSEDFNKIVQIEFFNHITKKESEQCLIK